MNYTREQAEEAKQIVKDFMKHHDICMNSYKWDDFLNAKFPPIEVGKWYKAEKEALICATSEAVGDGFAGFGFNNFSEWRHYENWGVRFFTPATDQEVLDRLTEEAKKRYKVGDRARSLFCRNNFKVDSLTMVSIDDFLWFSGIAVLDLSKGEWAEVVESNPIHDKIEKLERELAELKQLINK
jgi:hypothetical protein